MEECPVCYEEITEDAFKRLICTHILCFVCLRKLRNPSYPLCRTQIDSSYYERLIPMDEEDVVNWEPVENLDFDFSVQVHNRPRFRPRRRRRRSRDSTTN